MEETRGLKIKTGHDETGRRQQNARKIKQEGTSKNVRPLTKLKQIVSTGAPGDSGWLGFGGKFKGVGDAQTPPDHGDEKGRENKDGTKKRR